MQTWSRPGTGDRERARRSHGGRRARHLARLGVHRWLAMLVLVGLAPGLGWGHAVLVRSVPAHRAVLTRLPERVRLWFSEALEPRFARVSVWDSQERQVDREDVLVEVTDRAALSVGVPALAPGAYAVRYRVLSVDGHIVEGVFRFEVRAP